MFRTIETSIWHDPKFKALPAPAKLMFIYLITNPHAHVSGIYYLPDVTVLHEAGVKSEAVHTLWDTLSGSGLCFRDKELEVVWVKNMLAHQGRGDKNARSAAHQLKTLHKSSLINEYLKHYPQVKRHFRDRVSDRVNRPCPQEQDKDQEIKTPTESCGEPASAASPPPPEFPFFDCVPGRRSRDRAWLLTSDAMVELSQTFPGVDVPQECRKAWQWVRANPTKRKTAGGMPDFIYRWLSKAQDDAGRRGVGSNGAAMGETPRQYAERLSKTGS